MARKTVEAYLEVGKKRTFAGAIDWPGWARAGKDEASALDALLRYGARYGAALRRSKLGFSAPRDVADFEVVERLRGDSTTDFGAPSIPPEADGRPFDQPDLARSRSILKASWGAFDRAVRAAAGVELRTGPRGGGRDLDKIVRHVLEADAGYLYRLGVSCAVEAEADAGAELDRVRRAIVETLSAATGKPPLTTGPRGGVRWTPRYFVRRSAWHVLDHGWEIEDRSTPEPASP